MKLTKQQQFLIESAFGHRIKYPGDLEALSMSIFEKTGGQVSVNTLKRLFGIIEPEVEPRVATLDVLARYAGFDNWALLQMWLSEEGNSYFRDDSASGQEVDCTKLASGTIVQFSYSPGRTVVMVCLGDGKFCVTSSENSKLKVGDELKTSILCAGYPLVAEFVLREGKNLGMLIAGKTGGLTTVNVTGTEAKTS
jgi:hypothetical protein